MNEFFDKIFENKKIFWSIFGIIILFALGLRLTLIEFPLWYDEGCSIATAIESFPAGITNYLWTHDLQHTPLYFYILHFIMNIFGDGIIVLRLSSLVVSMALLPITFIVTEKLSSKKVALLAMFLMGINTFQVLYSIEIRMYPYVILLSLLSINYLIDYDRKEDNKSLIKLGLVNLLNPYFLTGSIVFVIVEFIIYSSYLDMKKSSEDKISRYVISNLILFLGYIPYFVLIGHYAIVRSKFLVTDLSNFTQMNFWGMFQNLFAGDAGHIHETRFEPFINLLKGDNSLVFWENVWRIFKVTFLVFAPIAAMFIGLYKSIFDKEKLNNVILCITTLCFAVFVFLAYNKTVAFTGRYLIFITPFIFILTAIGFSKFNKIILSIFIILYTTSCLWGFGSTYDYYKNIAEFSLKSPADFVHKNYPGKNNLVIMPFASSVSFYYFKGDDMPRVMPLELFHEVRNINSDIIYDDYRREEFKTKDKYKVFQNIILSDTYISNNLVKFLNKYVDSVPRGGYIIWVIYYSDNYALIPPEAVKRYYGDYNHVKDMTMSGVLSKFDMDLINVLSRKAKLIKRDRDASNQFFVFQKI